MEREELNQNREFITELTTSERPLVDRWVRECLPVFRTRNDLATDLLSGSVKQDGDTAVFQNGMKVPAFLVPIMDRWAKEGPIILTSYGHPEEFEMYKFMGRLNLVLFIERMREQGVIIPKDGITENWYETVALHRTVATPLKFGDTFPGSDKFPIRHDFFGLGNFRYGTEVCDFEQIERNIDFDSKTTASLILRRLSNEIESELVTLGGNKLELSLKREVIQDLLEQRLASVLGLAELSSSRTLSTEGQTVNKFLFDLEKRFAGYIVDRENGSRNGIDELTGIQGQLFSKNRKYIELIFNTLDTLVSVRGAVVLKRLVAATGDGLFSGFVEDRDVLVTVDSEADKFILMNRKSFEPEMVVGDGELIEFVRGNNFLPLAKAETLAILAGGMTFHMGSEHGSRPRILSALSIEQEEFPQFCNYLGQLRIGQDLEQGNNLFVLNGGQPIPAVLAFVLLGGEFLRAKMLEKAGVEFQPESLREKDFKKLVAKSLVENIKGRSVPDKNIYGGFLWS